MRKTFNSIVFGARARASALSYGATVALVAPLPLPQAMSIVTELLLAPGVTVMRAPLPPCGAPLARANFAAYFLFFFKKKKFKKNRFSTFFFTLYSYFGAGNATENQAIEERRAAQPIATVHAAHNFARGIKSSDWRAARAHRRVGAHFQTAHAK